MHSYLARVWCAFHASHQLDHHDSLHRPTHNHALEPNLHMSHRLATHMHWVHVFVIHCALSQRRGVGTARTLLLLLARLRRPRKALCISGKWMLMRTRCSCLTHLFHPLVSLSPSPPLSLSLSTLMSACMSVCQLNCREANLAIVCTHSEGG